MNPNVDVAIVGGGVAGAALALGLAQASKTVLVLERETVPALNGADVVKPAGINVLRELGILDQIVKRGRVRDRLDIYYDAQFVTTLDYKEDAADNFFVLTPYAAVLEVLRAALLQWPNVEYRCGSPVTRLCMEDDSVTSLQLASGEHVRARFYVGADGAQSFVRAQVGLTSERTVYRQRMYFGKFPIVSSVDDCNRLYIDSRGALAYFYPVGTTAFRAVLGFSDPEGTRLAGSAPEVLRARLRSFVCASGDAVDKLDGLASFAQIPVAYMHAPLYGRGNVALVGDAIHCVHPITGQGMNLGIEDAGALVGLVVGMFDGQYSVAECLEAYQRARWQVNRAVVEYGHALATSMTDKQAFVSNFDRQMQASRRRSSSASART
jgi:2-polyprenyl-6-methoxyphenol hydroxylase-like FAD-dependent oxidoreductase